jgi:hypothetical protein
MDRKINVTPEVRLGASMFVNSITNAAAMYALGLETGKLDPVTGFLLMRRDLAGIAERLEKCSVCRRDLRMAAQFDIYMIQAKEARTRWVGKRKWAAFKMYARFQTNIIRGILLWVPEVKWLIFAVGIAAAALTLKLLGLL